MIPSQIQDLIDKQVNFIIDPWVGLILVQLYKWEKSMGKLSPIFSNGGIKVDIALEWAR